MGNAWYPSVLGHTQELMLKLARDGEGEEGRVSCVAAASRIHRLSHLKCILTGSGPFSVLSSHLEGWGHTLGYTQRQSKGEGVTLEKVWDG